MYGLCVGHKNTYVPLILKVCDVIYFAFGKPHNGNFEGFFDGASKSPIMCLHAKQNNLPHFKNQQYING